MREKAHVHSPVYPGAVEPNVSAGSRVGDNEGDCAVGLLVVVEAVDADCDELSLRPSGRSSVYDTRNKNT